MLGVLILLLLSWGLLYLVNKQGLEALGFWPLYRLKFLAQGFGFTALLCLLSQGGLMFLAEQPIQLSENFTWTLLFHASYWDFLSVLTEELLFRGALLLVALKQLPKKRHAFWLSAIAFGVYHWFSYGIFGQWIPMLLIGLGTGIMGYAMALALYKSQSLWAPIGLHLGWNLIYNTVFSKGPLGTVVLAPASSVDSLPDWYGLFAFLIGNLVVPWLVLWFVMKRWND